jgi:hypothetical protein
MAIGGMEGVPNIGSCTVPRAWITTQRMEKYIVKRFRQNEDELISCQIASMPLRK